MNKRTLGVGVAASASVIIVAVLLVSGFNAPVIQQQTNEKIGLVINPPTQSTSLKQLDQVYAKASTTGIGRSNVYLFWNLVEPVRGEFDWQQSDALMSFNKKNNLKVTVYFSIINGETLGPFPDWIGKPPLNSIGEDRVVSVLDAVLSRYDIVDSVILAGQTESQFRYHEQNIPVYKELFNSVYDKIKIKHPDVKMGNGFTLDQVLSKNLRHIVTELSVGDFVAFSYSPVDILNDIVKTPQEAIDDLDLVFDLAGDKKVGFFEISWSTSDFVGGSDTDQTQFMEKAFEFYRENESEIEFFTWYRQYDRPDGTCQVEAPKVGDVGISVGGGSGFGSSEHIVERLSHYICSAGLINNDGTLKSGWNEFGNQVELLSQ